MHPPVRDTGLANPTDQPVNPAVPVVFVVLTFVLSSPFWYLAARQVGESHRTLISVGNMWSPALAAVLTRLIYFRSLRGFGFRIGQPRWLVLAVVLPAVAGLVMYGSAWLFDVAPFNDAKLPKLLSFSFIPIFLAVLGFTTFAALGEELGWRGLLVPELARRMGYTKLAFVSGIIWTVWHFPLMFLTGSHGTGPVWLALLCFIVFVIASSFVHVWMRLVSGSIWVSALLHGSANYFIQAFYPTFTTHTPEGDAMLGEYGWAAPTISAVIAIVFWAYRSRVPSPVEAR